MYRGELAGYTYVYVPPAGSTRVFIAFHGMGGSEEDLIPLVRQVDPRAGIVAPRGRVLEGTVRRFFRRLAPGVYDVEDLKRRADELAAFLETVVQVHQLTGEKVALGYSNGANIALAILFRYPDRIDRYVLLRPYFPVDIGEPDLAGKRVLLLAGRHDRLVPADHAAELAERLRRLGAEVRFHLLDAGHEIQPDDVRLIAAWLSSEAAAQASPSTS